ncbi:hypothetical protein [Nocardia bovistercoris]|uniref:Secreted protein n=1 Tax=Nocardia bovistercoris TaxID=2785916 RepID=A0A931ILQ7_9NOCA|nr:hypothetical protein [Nocardia bovistercoris]MBH0781833.1 hypothetical protein [Nocardia bovistercoris]
MFPTKTPRRLLAALAVAGAVTAIPLTVAAPASATGPDEATEIGRGCDRDDPWENFLDNPWSDLLDNRHGPHGYCDPGDRHSPRHHPPHDPWRDHRPHGLFGSS